MRFNPNLKFIETYDHGPFSGIGWQEQEGAGQVDCASRIAFDWLQGGSLLKQLGGIRTLELLQVVFQPDVFWQSRSAIL